MGLLYQLPVFLLCHDLQGRKVQSNFKLMTVLSGPPCSSKDVLTAAVLTIDAFSSTHQVQHFVPSAMGCVSSCTYVTLSRCHRTCV